MKKEEYIYSKDDFSDAIRDTLKNMFGSDLIDFIESQIIKKLDENVNLYRFYGRNCCGCVSDKDECDFAYGRGKAKGCWEKAKLGKLFNCPVRINGTFSSDVANKNIGSIDISDRGKKPYPIIELSKE